MIIVMKPSVSEEEIENMICKMRDKGLQTQVSKGKEESHDLFSFTIRFIYRNANNG